MRGWKWIAAALVMPLLAVTVMAAGPRQAPYRAGAEIIDNVTYFDKNKLLMFVTNTGSIAYDKTTFLGKADGLYFPRGTDKTVIFAGGIWMGAKVEGDVRVFVSEYSNECVPGPMKNGTYQPDQGRFRVYKVNRGDTRATNPDYAAWPFDDGAPALLDENGDPVLDRDGNKVPLIQGDQALWAVYNDADVSAHTNNSGSTAPLGVEIQQYVFGYARSGALGQTIFVRYIIINKGGNTLEDTYISLWADPDLGDAVDDFVGCDTALSLGFVYNDGDDETYEDKPPAAGYDFFQGPIVPVVPGEIDSAWISSKGIYIQGYKNLRMSSFNKYINGTDPKNNLQTYNYMQGLSPEGDPQADPNTGEETKFVLAGDPVAGTGWLDDASDDRRYMMSSGPFTMEPDDTQEVVMAVLVGQGADRLASITALKRIDRDAQRVFDLNFDIAGPPPLPTLWGVPHANAVQLFWGREADGDIQYELSAPKPDGTQDTNKTFVMEGLNVYQGESSSGPWTKIATYDVINDVLRIYSDLDQEEGIERVVAQRGEDTGLEYELWVDQDRIRSGRLISNHPYYFTVTSYNYDVQNTDEFYIRGSDDSYGIVTEAFENLPGANVLELTPRSMTGVLADTADHIAGTSDGFALIDYVDQTLLTGDTYIVDFNEDGSWNLFNDSDTVMVLSNQSTVRAVEPVDGFFLRVSGPELGVNSVAEVANGDGPVDPPVDVHRALNSTEDWYMSPSGGYSRYSWQGATDHDYEIRFTEQATEHCWDWFGEGDYSFVFTGLVPIEFWDITDDRRITFNIIDDDGSGDFSWGDGLYIWDIDYDDVDWETPGIHTGQFDPDYNGLHYGRFWFYDESGALTRPAPGTIIRVLTNKPNVPGEDVFQFTANRPGTVNGTAVAEAVDRVHPVPNPYYNVSELELDQFQRQIKFVNLPAATTTIRIFNLAGDLVKTLVKPARDDDGSPLQVGEAELTWDTLTEQGLPIASGLYIYHVEAEGIGTKVGKLAVFTEVEQIEQF